jgi:virginiamycin B lyase
MSPATRLAAWRRHVWLTVAVLVIVAAVVAFIWGPWRDSGFVEHRMLKRTDIPAAIAMAPDGTVWFMIEMSDAIGVYRHGRLERLSKRTPNLETLGLAVDGDGGVWYTDPTARAVSRMAADGGGIRSFRLTTPVARLGRLALGPDGAVWFADATTASVTRLKDGVFTRHVSRSAGAAPWGVAVEPAGTVWATLPSANRLARITPDGQMTEFDVPTRGSGLGDVAVDAEGAVWFLEPQVNKIGRFADDRFTEFAIPTPSPGLTALAVAPDGAVWFTELRSGRLGRLRDGHVTEFRLPRPDARPFGIAVDRANNVWYTDLGGWLGMLRAAQAMSR